MLFSNKNIVEVDIESSMKQSYLDYSMSVIVGRAIPDARDGLKPVHRRILYAMKELNLEHNRPYKKCARVVGDVVGKYHPHGDSAVYDALVRMAQDFSMRYPLVDGQGNFGSLDGDSPAAMRYTEARLSKVAEEMLRDLDKNTVDFVPNYDESLKEPSVLPSYIPNLLINGSSGIAVGFATNIPPHNLNEIIDASLAYLKSEGEITIDELMNIITGPDFPTGGICFDRNSIVEAYKHGLGRVKIRSKAKIERNKNKESIIVYEIPYQVNKSLLIQSISELVKNKKIEGITDIRDESSKEGVRIVIELKKDEQANVVLNNLYKYTNMQITFGINMLALEDNVPRVLNIKELIGIFVKHRINILKRKTTFLLNKARDRAHVLEGLMRALEYIDEVVNIIKSSKNTQEARNKLKERFTLSDRQAQAILDMKLSRLVGLERKKLLEEYKQLNKDIQQYETILSNKEAMKFTIEKELTEIKKIYGDSRKTEIKEEEEKIDIEDMIKIENLVVVFSRRGYIKTITAGNYSTQNKGGKGRLVSTFADGDSISDVFVAESTDDLLCFTNSGRVYKIKTYEIPKLQPTAKGKPIVNLLNLKPGEFVKTILPMKARGNLFFVTSNGIVKRCNKTEFSNITSAGKIAITLSEDDSLIRVLETAEKDNIILTTKHGMVIRFKVSDVRLMGRTASGVRGIKLTNTDIVVSADRFGGEENSRVLIVTAMGIGKLINTSDIRLIKRGGRGVIGMKLKEGNYVVASSIVTPEDDIFLITRKGKLIRIKSETLRVMGRMAYGIKLMELSDGDEVVGLSRVETSDD